MCTGRPAFRAETTMGVLHRVCNDTPRPIREGHPEIPHWLEAIVGKLLAKDPADRFQSAEEVAELLGQHLAHLQQPQTYSRPAAVFSPAGQPGSVAKDWQSAARLFWATGILSLVACGLTTLFLILRVGPIEREWPHPLALWFIAGGLLSLPVGLLIVLGAQRTQSHQSRGWALAAGLLSLLPVNPFLVFCWPVTIWTLLTLPRPTSPHPLAPIQKPRKHSPSSLVIEHPVLGGVAFVMLLVAVGAATYMITWALARVGNQARIDLELAEGVKYVVAHVKKGDETVATIDTRSRARTYLPEGEYRLSLSAAGYDTPAPQGDVNEFEYDHRVELSPSMRFFSGGERHRVFAQLTTVRKRRAQAEPGDNWVQLFNGQDLTGWQLHPDQPGNWTVQDGLLVGKGANHYLYTSRGDYQNFWLRAEVKINSAGDGGILVRMAPPSDPPAKESGYEVQLTGDPAHRSPTASIIRHGAGPVGGQRARGKSDLIRPDEWFVVDITVENGNVKVAINSRPVASYRDPAPRLAGHIALQSFSKETEVTFRKIEIKELSAPATAR
jgi:hypothetical protein